MRILFAGTSDIAVPVLKRIASEFEIAGVLTASDKPGARSQKLVSSPVKIAAQELGLEVIQCDHVNKPERIAVRALAPDSLVSFSFGRIFGPMFLGLFDRTMNIHPSPLPEARGPAPVQAAILSGNRNWAISFQEIGLAMDTGRLYDVLKFNLDGTETTDSLTQAIAAMAADRCVEVLSAIRDGSSQPVDQKGDGSVCSLVSKEDGKLDFSLTAMEVHSRIRAMYSWPKAFTALDGKPLFITGVHGGFSDIDAEPEEIAEPGTIMEIRKGLGMKVACADKAVWITRVQIPTKKEITFLDFANQMKGTSLVGQILGR